jgi:hypothetical protein
MKAPIPAHQYCFPTTAILLDEGKVERGRTEEASEEDRYEPMYFGIRS